MRIKLLAAILLFPLLAFGQVTIVAPPNPISIGDGIRLAAPEYDADAASYFIRAGVTSATAKQKINTLVRALKADATWSNVRVYLLRSTQNAGTGSTVYTLGGWSSDNSTLVGSPTWGTDGVDFNGTSQYCADSNDIWTGGTALTFFLDFNQDTTTLGQSILGVYGTTSPANQRGFLIQSEAGAARYNFSTSSDGSVGAVLVCTYGTPLAGAQRSIAGIYSASSLSAFVNSGSSTVTGSPATSLFNAATVFSIGAHNPGSPSSFFDGKIGCAIVIKQTLSSAATLRINAAMEGLR